MKQLKVSLPDDLRARLEAAAAKSGNSLGEEIRHRIEQTLEKDVRGAVIGVLLDDIEQLAELVKFDVGQDWHATAGAHAVFRSAVLALIEQHRPKGAPVFGAVRDLLGAGISKSDDPDTIGRALVRHLDRLKQVRRETMQELIRRQKGKGS